MDWCREIGGQELLLITGFLAEALLKELRSAKKLKPNCGAEFDISKKAERFAMRQRIYPR
jgi:hypothetical protein